MTPYRGWVVVRGCRRVTRMERCLGAPLFRSLGIVRGGVGGCFRQRCCGRCHVDDGNDIDTLNMSGSFYLECLSSVLYTHALSLSLYIYIYRCVPQLVLVRTAHYITTFNDKGIIGFFAFPIPSDLCEEGEVNKPVLVRVVRNERMTCYDVTQRMTSRMDETVQLIPTWSFLWRVTLDRTEPRFHSNQLATIYMHIFPIPFPSTVYLHIQI